MDIRMPFLDGGDTIFEIMKQGYDKNVIISISTARGTPNHEKIKGLGSFIFNYITKPFDIQKLLSNIRQMCEM
jgi:DNA-binding response OmpR family regulator